MTDVEANVPAAEVAEASPKKTKGRGKKAAAGSPTAKGAKKGPQRPATSEMVLAAIGDLDEKGGSSLHAIKKYISSNYRVDADKIAVFVRKYLRGAVESGVLVRTKGKGALGSFRLESKSSAPKTTARTAKVAAKKAAAAKKTKSPVKKAIKKKAKVVVAKPKKAPAKKSGRPPTKPKSPKPKKKGVAAKSKAIKKAKK